MQIQPITQNRYKQPSFQKLIVRPMMVQSPIENQCGEVLQTLENLIKKNPSIQNYAKELERNSVLLGHSKTNDLIIEYGEPITLMHTVVIWKTSTDDKPRLVAKGYSEGESVYKQIKEFDCRSIIDKIKEENIKIIKNKINKIESEIEILNSYINDYETKEKNSATVRFAHKIANFLGLSTYKEMIRDKQLLELELKDLQDELAGIL